MRIFPASVHKMRQVLNSISWHCSGLLMMFYRDRCVLRIFNETHHRYYEIVGLLGPS